MTTPLTNPVGQLFDQVRDITVPAGDLTVVRRRAIRVRRRRRLAVTGAAAGCVAVVVLGLVRLSGPGVPRTVLPVGATSAVTTPTRPAIITATAIASSRQGPASGAAGTAPAGFLRVPDLGPGGWRASAGSAVDHRTSPALPYQLPACTGAPGKGSGKGESQVYRRPVGKGPRTWVLTESRVTVDAAQAAALDEAMRTLLTCPGVMWEDGSDLMLVLGDDAQNGAAGPTQAWGLRGTALTHLRLEATGKGGAVSDPIQRRWMEKLIATALKVGGGA